jgi:hypothetical protein
VDLGPAVGVSISHAKNLFIACSFHFKELAPRENIPAFSIGVLE